MGGMRRGWWLVELLIWLGLGLGSAALGAWGQTPLTPVQDVVYRADGQPAAGSVAVSWGAFTTADGTAVAAGNATVTLGTGGALSVSLAPNAGATPMGSYYTAVFHLNDGTVSREFWVVPVSVPGGGAAKLAGIRNQVLPTSVAMQTVSKAYVDTQVAKAMAGVAPASSPFVLKGGDTLTGPLLLPADPARSMQAADKHYVDTSVAAAIAGGGGGTASGTATGDLSGSYPGPVVSAVHATAGTLDGVSIGGTAPANARVTSLTTNGAVAFTLPDVAYDAKFSLNTPHAGQQALINLNSVGSQIWQFGKHSDDSFLLFDVTGSRFTMDVVGNGGMYLMPQGGAVSVGSAIGGAQPGLFNVGVGNQFQVSAGGDVVATTYRGPASAPTGTCAVNGAWVLSQDGHVSFCGGGVWVVKI